METKTFSSALVLSFLIASPAAIAMDEEQREKNKIPTNVQSASTRVVTDSDLFEPIDDEDSLEQADVASQTSQTVSKYYGVWNAWGLFDFLTSKPEKTANASPTVSQEDFMKQSIEFMNLDPTAYKKMVEGLRNPDDKEKFNQAQETAHKLYEEAKKKKEEAKAQIAQSSPPIAQQKKEKAGFISRFFGYE